MPNCELGWFRFNKLKATWTSFPKFTDNKNESTKPYCESEIEIYCDF